MQRNTYNKFCVGGKRHLLISPLSPQIISPLSLIFHPLQLVIAQDIRLLPLHSWLCLLLLLFFLPESVQDTTDGTQNTLITTVIKIIVGWTNVKPKSALRRWWWWWWINESKRSVNRVLIDAKSVLIYMLRQTLKWALHASWASGEKQQWFVWFMLQPKHDHE